MAEVKWIKIVTDIFDDQKVRFIETLPNGDGIIVIWFKLLCLAGKSNSNGFLMMTDKIPYTDDILSSIFDRDIKLIQLSLATFQKLDMVEIIDNKIYLSNWEKHQNAEKLNEIREQTRLRVEKHRKMLECNANTVTEPLQERYSNGDVTQQNKNKKENKNKEIDTNTSPAPRPKKHKYGEFQNVLLLDSDLEKLKAKFTDWQERIETLSKGIELKGYKYKNHYLAILKWAEKDAPKPQKESHASYDLDEIEEMYKKETMELCQKL